MMVKMLDGIGKIVEGYNSVNAALENDRVEEIQIIIFRLYCFDLST